MGGGGGGFLTKYSLDQPDLCETAPFLLLVGRGNRDCSAWCLPCQWRSLQVDYVTVISFGILWNASAWTILWGKSMRWIFLLTACEKWCWREDQYWNRNILSICTWWISWKEIQNSISSVNKQRELISARKMSHEHNNKDPKSLR